MSPAMTAPVSEELLDVDPEQALVHEWRLEQLTRLCDGHDEAAILLDLAGADWHDVARARERGATVAQVLRCYG